MMLSPLSRYLLLHWVELSGWSTTILGIWLTARRSLWCWPITLVSDLLYLVVFYQARLLSDTLLQAFFIVFTLYGWVHWARGARQDGDVRIVPLGRRAAWIALGVGAVGSLVLSRAMIALGALLHIAVALPHLDAALASFSLVASWWAARKHTANWPLWIVVDVVYVGEYVYKGLWMTAVLYAILVGLAAVGLRDWRRAAAANSPAEPHSAAVPL